MKLLHLLSAATLSTAFVIPDEQVLADVKIETHDRPDSFSLANHWNSFKDKIENLVDSAQETVDEYVDTTKNALDDALATVVDVSNDAYEKIHEVGYDVESWLESTLQNKDIYEEFDHPHHGPPHHGPPHHEPPHHGPPHHEPPHHGHPPHHQKPNLTVYELIANSKYTTKLAKLINEDKNLVKLLNGTAANYTVFAPLDSAFEKIPKHAPKPPKDFIKALLTYHVSPNFYPAGRVLVTHTAPTLLNSSDLGVKPNPQRLSFNVGLRGLTVNFYSRIVAANIFGTNGVIHGLDSILIPPPKITKIIQLLPSEFSTLELGLTKTGLIEKLNDTVHYGGTFFAPGNFAFRKLGPRINAFLFSDYGEKYLNALLRYHVAFNNTLYSDAFYSSSEKKDDESTNGYFHADLPTLLDDHPLSVDIGTYGPFTEIKINGFSRVTVKDGIARDGVIQVVGNVLIPPRTPSGSSEPEYWEGEELTVDDLKQRLELFVEDHDEV